MSKVWQDTGMEGRFQIPLLRVLLTGGAAQWNNEINGSSLRA
jgi:hypothetical protein